MVTEFGGSGVRAASASNAAIFGMAAPASSDQPARSRMFTKPMSLSSPSSARISAK